MINIHVPGQRSEKRSLLFHLEYLRNHTSPKLSSRQRQPLSFPELIFASTLPVERRKLSKPKKDVTNIPMTNKLVIKMAKKAMDKHNNVK